MLLQDLYLLVAGTVVGIIPTCNGQTPTIPVYSSILATLPPYKFAALRLRAGSEVPNPPLPTLTGKNGDPAAVGANKDPNDAPSAAACATASASVLGPSTATPTGCCSRRGRNSGTIAAT